MRRLRRPLLITVAAIGVAAIGVGAYLVAGDDDQPRRDFALAADEICAEFANSIVAAGVPDRDDRDDVDTWAATMAEITAAHADELAALDIDGAGDLRDTLVTEAELRADWYSTIADGGPLPDPDDVDDPVGAELAASLNRVDTALEPFGGQLCGGALLTGAAADPLANPAVAWVDAAERACADAVTVLTDADNQLGAGATTLSDYLGSVADTTTELGDTIGALDTPEDTELAAAQQALTAATSAVAAAAAAGDTNAVRAANDTWTSTVTDPRLVACSGGLPAGDTTPSGTFVQATLPAPLGDGVGDGGIDDAAIVASYAAESLIKYTGIDPTNAFGAAQVLPDAIGGGVTAVAGGVAATPTTVSVSAAALPDPGSAPGETNPWFVAFAVADTNGGCAYGWAFGAPRLVGFNGADSDGACTADAALTVALAGYDPL